MTWDERTLVTFENFLGRIRSAKYLLQTDGDEEELFDAQYAIVKADIKKRLHIKFKDKYQNTPTEWADKARMKAETAARERRWSWYGDTTMKAQYAFIPDIGDWIGVADVGTIDSPILFLNNGVPTSSTYANTCEPGDFLINTQRNGFLYINRGSSATPSWVRWSYKDLTDYILGDDAMQEAAVAGLFYYMAKYIAVPQTAGAIGDYPVLAEMKKDLYSEYMHEFSKDYELLDVASDGSAILSNFDLEMQESESGFGFASPD